MFPLGSVLLPNEVLPLHVFEPRYRSLIQDCVESDDHEFGVTLIERGSEVGGGDQRRMLGTVARLLQVAELPDGRFAAVAVGVRRIVVNAWLPDDPYPLADVDDWPDAEETIDQALVTLLVPRVRRCRALAVELGDLSALEDDALSEDLLDLSFQLCSMAPLGATDRYELLDCAGPQSRLVRLADLLVDIEALLHFRLSAPTDVDPS
jgi:Lon protease-like protein